MLLKKQLLDAQRQAAELSTALETPDNKSRYTYPPAEADSQLPNHALFLLLLLKGCQCKQS